MPDEYSAYNGNANKLVEAKLDLLPPLNAVKSNTLRGYL